MVKAYPRTLHDAGCCGAASSFVAAAPDPPAYRPGRNTRPIDAVSIRFHRYAMSSKSCGRSTAMSFA